MIAFINKIMGNLMYVDDSRKDEYLAAGHKLAAPSAEKTAAKKPTQRRTVKK